MPHGWVPGQPVSGCRQQTPFCPQTPPGQGVTRHHRDTGVFAGSYSSGGNFSTQSQLCAHTHATCSAARRPPLGLAWLPREAFMSSYRKNVTCLLSFDFASSVGWIPPVIVIKEIMCISQFVFPHKNRGIMSFQFMTFSALGKTEVDRISVLKCNKRLIWHSSKCL